MELSEFVEARMTEAGEKQLLGPYLACEVQAEKQVRV